MTVANDSKFVARKCNIVNDQSNQNYDVGKEIIYNKDILKSNLCDYNGAYILVRGDITVRGAPTTQVSLGNSVPFAKCITKICGHWRFTFIHANVQSNRT